MKLVLAESWVILCSVSVEVVNVALPREPVLQLSPVHYPETVQEAVG